MSSAWRADPKLAVVQGPELRTIYLGFDHFRDELLYGDVKGRNPFKDHRVREAIYRAIDIAAIKRVVMRDISWPAGMMSSPFLTGAPSDINDRLAYDPALARKLLADAGFPTGFATAIACPNDRYVNDEAICQAIAGMLARVGIKLTIQSETTAVWSRRTASLDVSMFMLGHAGLPLADAYSTLSEVLQTPHRHHWRAQCRPLFQPGAGRADRPGRARRRTRRSAAPSSARRCCWRSRISAISRCTSSRSPGPPKKGIDMHQGPDNQLRLRLVTTP